MIDKQRLRNEISKRRDQLSSEVRDQLSDQIKIQLEKVFDYQEAQTIACFVSFRSEVNTIPLIKDRLEKEKRIVLPITNLDEREIFFSELKDFDQELELGTYGILEPKPEYIRPIEVEEIDLVLMPGLVFDEQGYRIGYGGGYYDRFLSKMAKRPLLVALAFDLQVIGESIPFEKFDIPVDLVVTEKGVIDCHINRKR